jgi:hypothetical protein
VAEQAGVEAHVLLGALALGVAGALGQHPTRARIFAGWRPPATENVPAFG